MKYERLPYMDPRAKVETVGTSTFPIRVPVFDQPISSRENFRRCIKRENPLWVPNSANDFNYLLGGDLSGLSDLRFDFPERCDWVDLFGCVWEFTPESGGSMLKPGSKPVLDDITEWEEKLVWPVLDEERIKACCEKVKARPEYHPEKMNYYDLGQGCTERLVAILGGYEEGMIALASEPEACKDFMMELSRFHIRMFDMIAKYMPTDMIMYHDDWGTERETFFGERMMESMVYEPTKLFFDHVKEAGTAMNFHCCGNIKRFMPYISELAPEFVQLQPRCNDFVQYKKDYEHIGFDGCIPPISKEFVLNEAHHVVDDLGEGGGLISTVFGGDEEIIWDGLYELNCYSREFYGS